MWQIKNDISPLPQRLWLPNLERYRFIIKDHHPSRLLTLWTRDQVITWLIKNVIFLLPLELCLRNLTEWCVPITGYYPQSHITCWSRGHIKSYNKWKTLKYHLHVNCGYQTWQKGGLWLGVTCLKQRPISLWQCGYVRSRDKWTSL